MKVLITGAFSPIGRAIIQELIHYDFLPILHYHTPISSEQQAWLNDLKKVCPETLTLWQADMIETPSLEKKFSQLLLHVGQIDGLINNAAIFEKTPLGEIQLEEWQRIMTINFLSPMALSNLFILQNHFTQEKPGIIINLLDIYAEKIIPGYSIYSASKSAMETCTRYMAREAGPRFRINGIAPGIVTQSTPMHIVERSVTRQLVPPEAIAQTCLFLMQNHHLTGSTITVDSGKKLF